MPVTTITETPRGHIRTTVRERPKPVTPPQDECNPTKSPRSAINDNAVRLYRLDGVGDIIFMEVAVRKLKACAQGLNVVLVTRSRYQALGKYLGFDATDSEDRKRGGYDDGVNLNWALEVHAASSVMDRVSIWEDCLHLPIGQESVGMKRLLGGREMIRSHPAYRPSLPNLLFAPFSIFPDRSFSPSAIRAMLPSLCAEYNVIVPGVPSKPPVDAEIREDHRLFHREKFAVCQEMTEGPCCTFSNTTLDEWFTLVGGCDLALGCDSANIYVAGAQHIPTVGVYSRVEPWLRAARFDTMRCLHLRHPGCRCSHHGPCTNLTETCKDLLQPDLVMDALSECADGNFGYYDERGAKLLPPLIEIAVADENGTGGDERKTLFSIAEAAKGITWRLVEPSEPPPQPGAFRVTVQVGKMISRTDIWRQVTNSIRNNPQHIRRTVEET